MKHINVNFLVGMLFLIFAPYLISLTGGSDPSALWPVSFLFITAIVTFLWAVVSIVDTYKREGLPHFNPFPAWPWCFVFWLLSISGFTLDASRARLEEDFHVHIIGNTLKFSLALWGVISFIQYIRFRFPDLWEEIKRFVQVHKRLDKKDVM